MRRGRIDAENILGMMGKSQGLVYFSTVELPIADVRLLSLRCMTLSLLKLRIYITTFYSN